MKKSLFAGAALMLVIAAPAFAQSHDPDIGAGNLTVAPYAGNRGARISNHRRIHVHRYTTRRFSPAGAYARVPQAGAPALGGGYRWPGAKYDADGRFIDQNSPGRW